MSSPWLRRVALAVMVASLSLSGYRVATSLDHSQWDFKLTYYASQASAAGLNPYDVQRLTNFSGGRSTMNYSQSPVSLILLRPFASLPYEQAAALFLALKGICLVCLIVVWSRVFLGRGDGLAYLFVAFAFHQALVLDLRAGNIVVFEQLLLWSAFSCYLRQRLRAFCLLVVAASLSKVTPIVFLLLVLWSNDRRRFQYLASATALFAALLALSFVVTSSSVAAFVLNAGALADRGWVHPSTLSLIRDICGQLGLANADAVARVAFLAVAGLVLWITLPVAVRMYGGPSRADRALHVCLACLTYALVVPRFKDYSFALLVVPAYIVTMGVRSLVWRLVVALLVCLPAIDIPVAPGPEIVLAYLRLFTVCLLWQLCLSQWRRANGPPACAQG